MVLHLSNSNLRDPDSDAMFGLPRQTLLDQKVSDITKQWKKTSLTIFSLLYADFEPMLVCESAVQQRRKLPNFLLPLLGHNKSLHSPRDERRVPISFWTSLSVLFIGPPNKERFALSSLDGKTRREWTGQTTMLDRPKCESWDDGMPFPRHASTS